MAELIENVLCFLIAASIVIQLAPNDSYKKCMKFFLGLVFLLLIVSSIAGESEKIDRLNIFEQVPDIRESDTKYYENIFNDFYGNVNDEKDR